MVNLALAGRQGSRKAKVCGDGPQHVRAAWSRLEAKNSAQLEDRIITHEEARRAYEQGLFAALRSFRLSNVRELDLEVVPYSSVDDARSMIPKLWRNRTPYPNSLTVAEEQIIDGRKVPEISDPWLLEQRSAGIATVVRVIIGRVDHVVLSVGCIALRDDWPWDEVEVLASLQGKKVLQVLGADRCA